MKKVKNIIFDLGGVLLNLAPQLTDQAFTALAGGKVNYDKIQNKLGNSFFDTYEIGKSSSDFFSTTLCTSLNATPKQVCSAWNAMLLDMPMERIELLKNLKKEGYTIYLLSNTNAIHLEGFSAILDEVYGFDNFSNLFEKAYYSHLIHLRKPNEEIYEYVCKDAGIEPSETIFVDDNTDNIQGAKNVGLHGILHPRNGNIKSTIYEALDMIQ